MMQVSSRLSEEGVEFRKLEQRSRESQNTSGIDIKILIISLIPIASVTQSETQIFRL